jgi:transcriptional regulator of acetoin/glycerol metabolism
MERYLLVHAGAQPAATDIEELLNPQMEWESLDRAAPSPPMTAMGVASNREKIVLALQQHEGHKGKTAQALGISRSTLYHKMARYGLR